MRRTLLFAIRISKKRLRFYLERLVHVEVANIYNFKCTKWH